MMANLLTDSGIHETLLMEEKQERMWLEGTDSKPDLNTSALRLVPYGMKRSLELLGKIRC